MNKNKILKIINLILAADFLIIAVTAIFHELIIPTGFYPVFHAVPGFIFIVLVVTHIILNRNWIKNTYFKK